MDIQVSVGVLRRDNKLLFTERLSQKSYGGYWEFPGGKLMQGETSLDAIKRELQEELGIRVNAAVFLFTHTHDYPDQTVILHVYHILDYKGEPLGCEGQSLQWLSLPELNGVNLLPANWVLLERLQTITPVMQILS
jgi:8-oxo-dGTP diphosphatase